MKLFLSPNNRQIADDNGLGKVVHALYAYLPELGIEFVDRPQEADVIAAHVIGNHLPRLDVLHLHGAYFQDDGEQVPEHWMSEINRSIATGCRKARAITIPSEWASMFLKRDMRLLPEVIPNGVDLALWEGNHDNGHYVLWNKNRVDSTVDPHDAYELAKRGVTVVSTYPPGDIPRHALPSTLKVTGRLPFSEMVPLIKNADVYLATTREVMSLSVLEALAAGVPVLGYNWGGVPEVVRHKIEGYLVEPGDVNGLLDGLVWIRNNRHEVSKNARQRAQAYSWQAIAQRYAALYHRVMDERQQEKHTVAVVIPAHNYGRYVTAAIDSVLDQTRQPEEIIVVDDGSTDDTAERVRDLVSKNPGRIRYIHQENLGVATARNNGIRATTADYIVCLDADDILHPAYIETLRGALVADRALGVAWSKLQLFDDANTPLGIWDFDFNWEDQASPAEGGQIRNGIPAGAMFRREMWRRAGGYKQVYHPAEDAELWVRGLSIGFEARRITNEPLYWYRMHQDSASNVRKVPAIHAWHPWATDKQYPFAAPISLDKPMVRMRSYSRPLVSVIIPAGPGHAKYLPGALDSLLGQTFRNWEAIVIDDSDTDEVRQILEPYPFVNYVSAALFDHGAGMARNLGLEAANAPLCFFLDADDYLMPPALEKMLGAWVGIRGQKYIYSDWIKIGQDGSATPQASYDYDQLKWLQQDLHSVSVLMQTEDARRLRFDEDLPGWEDWEFFIRCAVNGICGYHLAEPLLAYRIYSGQRREAAEVLRHELQNAFNKKYGGTQLMACGCSGKTANTVTQAQQAVMAAQVTGPTHILMEYTGPELGSVPYKVNGRTYRGANNDAERYSMVQIEDVDRLKSLGVWREADPSKVIASV